MSVMGPEHPPALGRGGAAPTFQMNSGQRRKSTRPAQPADHAQAAGVAASDAGLRSSCREPQNEIRAGPVGPTPEENESGSLVLEVLDGVYGFDALADLEAELGCVDTAGSTGFGDDLTAPHALTRLDGQRVIV